MSESNKIQSVEKKIIVYCPIFNEERYLEKLIKSVLTQTYSNFTFLISDNHSTDSSAEIIQSSADKRLVFVRPPEHYSALNHFKWLNKLISEKYHGYEYSAFVGGHDIWDKNYLSTLASELNTNSECILAYADTFEISETDQVIKKYPINISTKDIPIPLRPIYILNGLTHNITFGGVWRENIRRKIFETSIVCGALDHLLIARASLYGDILHVPGTTIRLRRVDGAGELNVYYKKHLGLLKDNSLNGVLDFKKQLAFAIAIQNEAVIGFPFYEHNAIRESLILSIFNTYLARYIGLLTHFEKGPDYFFSSAEVKEILKLNGQAADIVVKYLEKECEAIEKL